jgi:hypothetical protein
MSDGIKAVLMAVVLIFVFYVVLGGEPQLPKSYDFCHQLENVPVLRACRASFSTLE